MRINPFIRTCLIVLCILLFKNTLYAQTLSPEDFSNPKDINADLFSFNAGFMMEVCGNSDDSLYVGLEPPLETYYLNSSCVDLTNDINPSVIRFPGGSGANYYHFYGSGYGYIESEVFGQKFAQYLEADSWIPENYIENFKDLALQTGSKAIYVANVFTHFKGSDKAINDPTSEEYQYKLRENLDAISFLVDNGVEVVGVELGNELYNYVEVNSTSGQRSKYLRLCEVYSDSIKLRFPGMEVGVPLQPVTSYTNLLLSSWNRAMNYAHFADAFIIHDYEKKVKNFCTDISDIDEYFACAKTKIDQYLDVQLEFILDNYWKFYGRDKKFWMTEWNMLNPEYVANTFLHAYFLAKYWNNLMELDKKNPNDITLSNCHNLISGGLLYPAIGRLQPNESTSLAVQDEFVYRSAYFSHKMMSPLLTGQNKYVGATTINNCQTWIYELEDGSYEFLIINDQQVEQDFSNTDLNNVILNESEPLGFIEFSQLSADKYHDAAGTNYFNLNTPNVESDLNFILNSNELQSNTITLPGLSITKLKLGTVEITEEVELSELTIDVANCLINVNWSAINENQDILYVIEQDGIAVDSINASGNNSHQIYSSSIEPAENVTYTFQVHAYQNNEMINSSVVDSINIDCIEEPLPVFNYANVIQTSNCVLNYSWEVSSISTNSFFVIEISTENDIFIDTLQATDTTIYSYSYSPTSNETHQFQAFLYENDDQIAHSYIVNSEVECVYIPPTIQHTIVTPLQNCSYQLNWEVNDEKDNSIYHLFVSSNNSNYELVSTQYSDINAQNANYVFNFIPENDGNYQFKLEHFIGIDLESIVFFNPIEVGCVVIPDPSLVELSATANEDCTVDIFWSIEDEQNTSSYEIYFTEEGNLPILIETINASSDASYTSYTSNFVPTENGEYSIEILQFNNGNFIHSTSTIVEVGCIPIPDAEITNFEVIYSEDCSYAINWIVENENLRSYYEIDVVINNDTISNAYTTSSTSNLEIQDYTFNYFPEENGIYSFVISHYSEENELLNSQVVSNIEVDCIVPPTPSFIINQINENDDCEINLVWQVENHIPNSAFVISINANGNQFIDTVQSSLASLYSYLYLPAENGDYQFSISIIYDDVLLVTSTPLSTVVECVYTPPFIINSSITQASNCAFNLNWIVANEQVNSIYYISASLNGGAYYVLYNQVSAGNIAAFAYQYNFNPQENGVYSFKIIHFVNGVPQNTYFLDDLDVSCIPAPDPILSSLTVIEDENCSIKINWHMDGELATSAYNIYTAFDSGNSELIATINATQDVAAMEYQHIYLPEVNGNYSFVIDQLREGNVVASFSEAIQIGCVPIPDPILSDLTVAEDENCSIKINWHVDGELATSAYNIYAAFDGENSELITTINATQDAAATDYQHIYLPEANGSYSFVIEQLREGNVVASFNETIQIGCVPIPDPEIASVNVSDNGDCTFNIEWFVTNEITNSSYAVIAILEGDTIGTIYETSANNNAEIMSYNYTAQPTINGEYIIIIEHYIDGNFINATASELINVNCIIPPAEIQSVRIFENGDCSFTIDWSVSNETVGSIYDIKMNFDNLVFETIESINSNGVNEIAYYSYTYYPEENGNYQFQIDRYEDAEMTQQTDVIVKEIECIVVEPILPELISFNAESYSDCSVDFDWEVINQDENTTLVIKERVSGNNYNTVASFTGDNTNSTGNYSIPVLNSGNYKYIIEVYQNGEFVTTSNLNTTNVTCPLDIDLSLDAYPFFTFGDFTVEIETNQPITGTLQVVSIFFADVVYQEELSLSTGENNFYFDFDNWNIYSGLYRIIFTAGNESESETLFYF